MHAAAPHSQPFFIPGADGSDTLMVVMGIFLVVVSYLQIRYLRRPQELY